ncbi:MAG TPA: SWIM zinc finger family protein [Phycisphaerales bacterium]|nr:SWIM zinc finger family protein [Phycisphaerales bacterium]
MQAWTVESVVALAPDAASASAGQALASERKWSGIGRSDRAVWGFCQGSGKDPYQARVDLSEPAFKCSCPSRKFPCKHGLALMLLLAKSPGVFKAQAEPGWVSEWIAGRSERAEKKVEKAKAAAEKPVDIEAQAKRAAQRTQRVQDGIAGCRVWLEDLVRRGLAAAQGESAASWDRMAARMVDAQAPGLAAMVRRMPEVIASGAGWEVRTLDHLGRIHTLMRAGERLSELPGDVAGDVRVALGWPQSKDEVLASEGVRDRWVVLGQVVEEEDRLRTRRTWLVGRGTRRRALLLDFAAGLAPLEATVPAGVEVEGELAFYPSRQPLRALVKGAGEPLPMGALAGATDATIEEGLASYAAALAANPWTGRWPLLLEGVRLVKEREEWCLVDRAGDGLPLRGAFTGGINLWRLLSASRGDEATVLVEWDGESAMPVGAVGGVGDAFLDLAPRWAA